MPPKKAQKAPSRKAEQKAVEKIVEDKTFGLKNKNKSKKVQQYCASVKQQAESKVRPQRRRAEPTEAEKRKAAKEEEKKKQEEMRQLFKPTIQQPKVPPGVDPKSFVCEYWKAGLCTKGDKCRFSHDLNAGKKKEQIDLYTDRRTAGEPGSTMEDWDQATLESVVEKRRTEKNRKNQTTIVCKYFLEALEQKKYGWFWECPNGDDCQYVHALPPGFVLKTKEKATMPKEEDEGPSLEEQIELDRLKVKDGEPVTKESFAAWKKAKQERKAAEQKKADEEKKKAVQQGRTVLLSGRELLIYKPQLFADDEEAMDDSELKVMSDAEYDKMQQEEESGVTAETEEAIAAAAAAADIREASAADLEALKGAVSIEEEEKAEVKAATDAVGDASLFLDDDDDDDDDYEEEEGADEGGETEQKDTPASD